MSVILFLILVAVLIGGGTLIVKRYRAKELERREKLSRIANGSAGTSNDDNSSTGAPATGESGTFIPNPVTPDSPEADTGADPAVEAVEVLPSKPALSAAASATWAETLKAQMRAVISAHETAFNALSLYNFRQRVVQDYEGARLGPLRGEDATDPAGYVSRHVALKQRFLEDTLAMEESRAQHCSSAVAAQELWKTLAQSTKYVSRHKPEALPLDLRVALTAAIGVQSECKAPVERLCSSAAECSKNTPKPRPAAPNRNSYEKLLSEELIDAINQVVAHHLTCESAITDCRHNFYILADLAGGHFTEPAKPTEEEVGRYIREVETWSKSVLIAVRAAALSLPPFQSSLPPLQDAIDAANKALFKVADLSKYNITPEDEAKLLVAREIVNDAATHLKSYQRSANEFLLRGAIYTAEVPLSKPEEAQAVTALRNLFRTLGFAVAQTNVALNKWQQAQGKLLSEPTEPRFLLGQYLGSYGKLRDSGERPDMDKFLKVMEAYFKDSAVVAAKNERVEAEIEVAQNALDARRAKVQSSAETLSVNLKQVEKTLTDDTTDELRVLCGAAQKFVDRHQH